MRVDAIRKYKTFTTLALIGNNLVVKFSNYCALRNMATARATVSSRCRIGNKSSCVFIKSSLSFITPQVTLPSYVEVFSEYVCLVYKYVLIIKSTSRYNFTHP